jgi:hypothetical protein
MYLICYVQYPISIGPIFIVSDFSKVRHTSYNIAGYETEGVAISVV